MPIYDHVSTKSYLVVHYKIAIGEALV